MKDAKYLIEWYITSRPVLERCRNTESNLGIELLWIFKDVWWGDKHVSIIHFTQTVVFFSGLRYDFHDFTERCCY